MEVSTAWQKLILIQCRLCFVHFEYNLSESIPHPCYLGVFINSIISLFVVNNMLSYKATSTFSPLLPMCLRVHSNNISTLAPAWWIEWLSSNLGSWLKLNRSFISSGCHLTLREWNAQVQQKWQAMARCQSWQWPKSRRKNNKPFKKNPFHNVVLICLPAYVLFAY